MTLGKSTWCIGVFSKCVAKAAPTSTTVLSGKQSGNIDFQLYILKSSAARSAYIKTNYSAAVNKKSSTVGFVDKLRGGR